MPSDDTAPIARNRATLRKYFASGRRPTEAEFAELIESMLNMQDEGFAKTPDDGLKVTAAANEAALLTFFREEDRHHGLWSVRYGGLGDPTPDARPSAAGSDRRKRNPLAVFPVPPREGAGGLSADPARLDSVAPLLALHQEGRVSIGKHAAEYMLDVHGMVAARGRVGTVPVPEPDAVRADGKWKDVTGPLSGCVAFEVVASVSAQGTGHHAIVHAVAMNAHHPRFGGLLGWLARHGPFAWIERRFNRRTRIRCQHAWFGDRCDRLELQWAGGPEEGGAARPYRLQIRTGCGYPDAPRIHLHVTQLWPTRLDADPGAAS